MKNIALAIALLFPTLSFAQTIAATSQLPTECIPCPGGTSGPSCARALTPRCRQLMAYEIQRLVYEGQAKEREMIPAACSQTEGQAPIVVPPVIAAFDPFAVAIQNQVQTISQQQIRECRKAREKFYTWLRKRNAALDADWDARLKARLAADLQPTLPLYGQQLYGQPMMPQSLAAYCSQYLNPDENAACLYQGIAQFYQPPPGQAPAGYIPMPSQGQTQYQEGQ